MRGRHEGRRDGWLVGWLAVGAFVDIKWRERMSIDVIIVS